MRLEQGSSCAAPSPGPRQPASEGRLGARPENPCAGEPAAAASRASLLLPSRQPDPALVPFGSLRGRVSPPPPGSGRTATSLAPHGTESGRRALPHTLACCLQLTLCFPSCPGLQAAREDQELPIQRESASTFWPKEPADETTVTSFSLASLLARVNRCISRPGERHGLPPIGLRGPATSPQGGAFLRL